MSIKRFTNHIFFFLSFLFTFYQVKSQSLAQDSLILVSLYNRIPALQADTTWLNGNLSTWNGISVSNNRVQFLALNNVAINDSIPREICGLDALNFLMLAGCQLKGNIPACITSMSSLTAVYLNTNQLEGVEVGADFSQLTQLQNFAIPNNLFTDMPDFISISSPVLNSIDVRQNYFNFDDLIPLTTKPMTQYLYEDQHQIGEAGTYFTVNVGDSADFPDASLLATSTNNNYTWLALDAGDSTNVPPLDRFRNINTSVLRVEGAQLADYKLYGCNITNPNLPGLTLRTMALTMRVIDPFLPQSITYQGDTIAYCGDTTLLLIASAMGGRPVSFVSLNDTIATANSNHTLSIHKLGTVTIRVTVAADSLYHGATLDKTIAVASHLTVPVWSITKELPAMKGDDLHLSVQNIPGLNYQWTTPSNQIFNTAAITLSALTPSDLGSYNVSITEGSCDRYKLATTVDVLFTDGPIIYELITPNGDGDNEIFYIENLDPTVHNEVSIFNVTHQIVYHEENYRNDWSGGNLPIGTYYYVLKYGGEIYKGNLYIKR